MRRLILCVVVVCLVAGTGRADFILSGSEHREVDSIHDIGILYDSSTANVVVGGHISNAYVNNSSSLTVSDGNVGNLKSYDTSGVDISGGGVDGLNASGASSVNISGGTIASLKSQDTSDVSIFGGSVNRLNASGTSSMAISSGDFDILYAYDISGVNISGGNFNDLFAHNTSSIDISGGDINNYLKVYSTSSVTFHGYDFRVIGGLRLEGDRVLGTGILTGKWFDATPWIVSISRNDSSATVRAVPEPSSLVLLAIGAVGLLGYVWRLRQTHSRRTRPSSTQPSISRRSAG